MPTHSSRRRRSFKDTVHSVARHSIFGSIKDALFGEAPKTETENLSTLSPEQEQAQKVLTEFLQTGGNPANAQPFQGELIAPLSNLEQVSLAGLEDRARAIATQTDPNLQAASEALLGILSRGPTDISEFVRSNIEQPLTEMFERNRTATAGRFADQFFGSQRREADARDFEEFMESLAGATSSAALEARNQDTNAILEAIGLAPNLARSESSELINLLQAGSVPRDVETARLQSEFDKFREFTSRQQNLAQVLNSFLGVPARENVVTQTGGSKGLLGGALEAGAKVAGAKLGGMLF